MALGKPVVYHNPHGERVDTFQEPMGAFEITRDTNELARALRKIMSEDQAAYREACGEFFNYHVSVESKSSPRRIAEALAAFVGSRAA